jgi:hypothetical protein
MIRRLSRLLGFDQCWHDWEYLEGSTVDKVRHEIDSERAGRHLSIVGCSRARDQFVYRRVCLKCRKVEDTIAEARKDYIASIVLKNERQQLALAIERKSQ